MEGKDIVAQVRERYGEEEIVLTKRVCPTQRAEIALQLAIHWGMVAGETDGEDSAGRSKIRRMTPDEITQHACDTAASLWEEFEKRDWLLDLPLPRTPEEIKAAKLAEGK